MVLLPNKLTQMEKGLLGYETIDLSRPNIANELKLFLQHHKLPLEKDSRTGITEMVASVGQVYFQGGSVLFSNFYFEETEENLENTEMEGKIFFHEMVDRSVN
ncbi:hypothetical protein ACSBR1_020413 [Camellia fascicularis]